MQESVVTNEPLVSPEFIAKGWADLHSLSTYGELKALSLHLANAAEHNEPNADLFILRGASFQKRADWNGASDLLVQGVALLPDRDDLLYEAALNSVDASLYARAGELLNQLGDRYARLTDGQLRGLWRASSLVGLHDLARRAFDEALNRGSASATPALNERIALAQANSAEQDAGLVSVISIGENCYPWMVMNRWGVRTHALSTSTDGIFNLAQSSIDGCASIIAGTGADLMDRNDLQSVIKSEGATPLPTNVKHGIEFNHEQGDDWVVDDFARLEARYAPRIANFQASLAGGAPRVFVHYTENPGNMERLVNAITAVNGDDNYRVVIIDASHLDRPAIPPHPLVDIITVSRPRPDYIWYRPDDLESAEGIQFERVAVEKVLEAVRNLRKI